MIKNLILSSLICLVSTSCYYNDAIPSDQNVWTAGRPTTFGMDEELLLKMDSLLDAQPNEGVMSIVIIKDDHLIYEKYYHGHSRKSLFDLGGVSSPLANVALGRAIQMGLIASVDDSIYKYLPEFSKAFEDAPLKKNITFEHLMAMKSGLSWNEFQGSFDGQLNDLDKIVISESWAEFIISKPLDASPGARYSQNSAMAMLIAAAIENQYGDSYQNFLVNEAFREMDIQNIEIAVAGDRDNAAWGIAASTLDLAKIGYLYLNQGSWFGDQLMDEAYVSASVDVQTSVDYTNDFGWMWWRYSDKNNFLGFLAQNDVFFAAGNADERLYVIPHLDMVVAITGKQEGEDFALSARYIFRDYILRAIQ